MVRGEDGMNTECHWIIQEIVGACSNEFNQSCWIVVGKMIKIKADKSGKLQNQLANK